MPIAEQTLQTLEFPKIRAQLAYYTSFAASRTLALELCPSTDATEVARALRRTSEARRMLDEYPDATIGGARDIRELVHHAALGGTIESSRFLDIAATLRSIHQLRRTMLQLDPQSYPLLYDYATTLPQLGNLEETINLTIGDDGGVLDSASPDLARIRRKVSTAAARLHDRLQAFITSPRYASALQETIVTVRNGRYVVPVRVEQRRSVRGLVHDQSASGATIYVEPFAIVELNNQWQEYQIAEEHEVERVLFALSSEVGAVADLLIAGVETLALIDLAFAHARYANALDAVEPAMHQWNDSDSPDALPLPTNAPLMFTAARHPLLDSQTVVPIDVWLGGDFSLLLITGPNTGGKTVALKTVGLLVLMAQAGLHIPARDPSHMPVFEHIFVDIGDEQSIEQNLSTFSSHMTTIIRILNAIEENRTIQRRLQLPNTPLPPANTTLVLLDEIGAGTDPVEGASLARAITERFLEYGCLGIFTTHYAELKAVAHTTPGLQNASVEFDIETLSPTYRLTIGLPGRSNALAIAARLGLDVTIVERARTTTARDDIQFEDVLAAIHHERESTAAALQRAEELRHDAQIYRDRLAQELAQLEATRQETIDRVYQETDQDVREIRAELRRLREELRHGSLSRPALQESETRLHDLAETIESYRAAAEQSPPTATSTTAEHDRPFQVGDRVLVRSVGLTGEILSIDENDQIIMVQVGGFRLESNARDIRRAPNNKNQKAQHSYPTESHVSIPSAPTVSMTFDMRGWRAAEVNDRLDRYLNDAYMAGLAMVHLIHGKGSGSLRKAVHEVLHDHPLVTSFDSGRAHHNNGMTIARLAER